jgi:cellulose synthase/poly-beta-1,6-N-acetylglucosamine synthase-like glycosyltransferase
VAIKVRGSGKEQLIPGGLQYKLERRQSDQRNLCGYKVKGLLIFSKRPVTAQGLLEALWGIFSKNLLVGWTCLNPSTFAKTTRRLRIGQALFFRVMRMLAELLFWTGFIIVFYAYVGYGVVLYILVRLKRIFYPSVTQAGGNDPGVTFIICAYNEAGWITEKINNSLAVDYPQDLITFLFVTDGSDDETPDLIRNHPFPAGTHWKLLHQPERRGKIAAFQRSMDYVQTPLVISTDANTLVNREAVRNLVRYFNDPKVGAVAGEKRISMADKDAASSAGEGIYWKYESALKKWDAELWSVVGAAGELFAFRTAVYEPVPTDTIVEDFYLTMRIAQKGYRVQYAPDAYAVESSSASVGEELKRKIRIAAGGIQAVVRLAPILNIFRYGILTFQYISHRVLRWTLAPIFLPVLFFLNIYLAFQGSQFYQMLLLAQLLFYSCAMAGYFLEQRKMKVKIFFVPYYFCFMNYSMYAGFLRYMRGGQSVLWEKVKRA